MTPLLLLGYTLVRGPHSQEPDGPWPEPAGEREPGTYVGARIPLPASCATLLILAGVWGARLLPAGGARLLLLRGTGVAMVAQWSILPTSPPALPSLRLPKIGDRIRILDKDDSVTGIITEIGPSTCGCGMTTAIWSPIRRTLFCKSR